MTIQSRINKENTTPTSAGLAPSEWAAKSLKKKPKRRNKTRNPIDHNPLPSSQAEAAKHLCHHAGLHLALSSNTRSRSCKTWTPQPSWKRE
jgi:transcription initiation factor TFIID subunit TAF12